MIKKKKATRITKKRMSQKKKKPEIALYSDLSTSNFLVVNVDSSRGSVLVSLFSNIIFFPLEINVYDHVF